MRRKDEMTELVHRMAAALEPLSDDMLIVRDSGTAHGAHMKMLASSTSD
jgi:hypothetical protein